MSFAREPDKSAGNDVAGLREWVRPIVHGLAAGDAEDGANPTQDGILNPS